MRAVSEAVLAAYTLTGCRDYARVDLRMNAGGEVFVLEVNPNPDLTAGVSFMESAEKAGLSFGQTLGMIVGYALDRRRTEPPPTAPPTIRPEAPIPRAW
jgi:D-alanine-D-alanine ligase